MSRSTRAVATCGACGKRLAAPDLDRLNKLLERHYRECAAEAAGGQRKQRAAPKAA